MRILLYSIVMTLVVMSACNNKSNPTTSVPMIESSDSLVLQYEEDLFSLLLPQGWTWKRDTVETWNVKHVVDSLGITSGAVELYAPDYSFKITLVKGVYRIVMPNNPVSDFGALVQWQASNDPAFVYVSEVTDSLLVDGNEACSYIRIIDNGGNSIVQEQYAVIKGKYDIYYLSGFYDYGDEKSESLWHKILATIKLK